ncbi:uncharacterized protein LOC126735208 [Anthonomus grandis grandis]|uniref:uncharacterized protein LOC126735208 n=1 Tax=Anthonomus grandis grandis TaxID=2921223 RepID=UPI00216531D8|nr:uncharacterized protein LOC126735208 [Anthonomus grandis grandis]
MFTYPPYPPKDYVLKEQPKIARSSAQFTPDSEPRVTQTSLGIFCAPVEYPEGETPAKVQLSSPNPKILEKWAKDDRAWWVPKPGKDDFFIHDMYKKYNVTMGSYNPAHKHMEKVFNRSYKYELVCLEESRLQKLRNKCEKEENISEALFKSVEKKEHEESHPPMKVLDCKAVPPFWWKTVDEQTQVTPAIPVPETVQTFSGRWAQEPCLTAVVVDDPCRRKFDMQLVGLPFRTEACNFYYEHYPPPDIKFRPKKIQ